jgi:hypothetical protein
MKIMLYVARADPEGLIAPSGAIPSVAADVRNPLMVVHAITTRGFIPSRKILPRCVQSG